MTVVRKRSRVDGQITGLAGEFFVAGELLKRGLQTSLTIGNAKAIDLFAHHPQTDRRFTVQVKAVRTRNVFPISASRVEREHIYVFVILNKAGDPPTYFVVPGADLAGKSERFGKGFRDKKFPGISPALLDEYRDNWSIFDER